MQIRCVKFLQNVIIRLFESKLSIHVLFCLLLLLLNLSLVFISAHYTRTYPLAIISFLLQLCSVYAGRWICRKWFLWNRLIPFIINTILCIVILSGIGLISFPLVSTDAFIGWKYFIISAFTVIPSLLIGIFLSLTRTTLKQQINAVRIAEQHKESELNLLQSQLTPHFLFNTLNNLYGLSITDHKKIPNLLLRLSELLSYSVYNTKLPYVPLQHELDYIYNYIELEKIRIGDRLLLSIDIQEATHRIIKVAPMIFIVFVENAFKHSKNSYDDTIEIKIILTFSENDILFSIKNSIGENISNSNISESSGLGLSVALRRLDLLYPGEYELNQKRVEGFYLVELKLKIK